jgi:hypothetical protein
MVGSHLREVPTDPFDGKALRYRRKGAEDYVLYSVGPNLTDAAAHRRTRPRPCHDQAGRQNFSRASSRM